MIKKLNLYSAMTPKFNERERPCKVSASFIKQKNFILHRRLTKFRYEATCFQSRSRHRPMQDNERN